MPVRRFIPALTTFGVVAGLATARMVVEVVTFGRATEALSALVHGAPEQDSPSAQSTGQGVATEPKRAGPARRVVSVFTIEDSGEGRTPRAVPVPSLEAEDREHPATPVSVPAVPLITNRSEPLGPSERWIGA